MLKEQLKHIWDVYSGRKAQRSTKYKPDEVSEAVRNRILLLLRDVLAGKWFDSGGWESPGNNSIEFWKEMHNRLQHLYGRGQLCPNVQGGSVEEALTFVATCKPIEFLDFFELVFKISATSQAVFDENLLVEAFNEILRKENAPYQLTPMVKVEEERPRIGPLPSGRTIRTVGWPKVVRTDEEVTHDEAVAPALSVLGGAIYGAANQEFRDALDEYRKGVYGDCLAKCGSAFESVLKVLCSQNGWSSSPNDTAAPLLKVVLLHTNLPSFFEQPLILIATMRNKLSAAHGGGTAVRSVERHVAQYAITSTAAAIVLLVHEIGS